VTVMKWLSPDERRRQRVRREYEERMTRPLDSLLSSLLELWVEANAEAIGIGFRNGDRQIPEVVESEDRTRISGTISDDAVRNAGLESDPAMIEAFRRSSKIRNPGGRIQVPMWLKINGEVHPYNGLPLACLGFFMELAEERLVSIGGTKESPQPLRYIEIKRDETNGDRRFIEVELLLDDDNTFWIKLLGERRLRAVEDVVSVSQYYY
jgi:hypothetical protein